MKLRFTFLLQCGGEIFFISTWSWATKQMFLGAGKFLKVTQQHARMKKERYDSGCNIRNRFGAVSNHLSLSLITFDRAAVRRDIKVDSVTKLPQYGGTYEGILCLIFPPSSTFHLHKSTQTITSSHEYKAITDSLRVEIILTLLQRWYNYHANLAHQQFKTLSVIISRIRTPTKSKKRKREGGGGGEKEIMLEQVPITTRRMTPPT